MWGFVEMEYPVRHVAAFRFPPMILRRPSDLFISAWMWVFTRLWRSGRHGLAVAWWILKMLIYALPHVSLHQAAQRVHGPCAPAPFFVGVYADSQPVLWGETHVCAERWLLWYSLFRHCMHLLALRHRPYLLQSQNCCLQQCNIPSCTLDTSPEILLNIKNCFLEESGSPAALQLLLSFAWPVQCKVALHVYPVVQDSMKITLPVALVCNCHLWHNFNDHCHCHCIQLDNELRSFCFPFFSSKILDPILPLQ